MIKSCIENHVLVSSLKLLMSIGYIHLKELHKSLDNDVITNVVTKEHLNTLINRINFSLSIVEKYLEELTEQL